MYEPHKPYVTKTSYTVKNGDDIYVPYPPLDTMEMVDRPSHYTWHPCGLEAKDIAQEFTYNIGTAIAYLWRHEYKNGIEDLKKAVKHIEFEIQRLEREVNKHD